MYICIYINHVQHNNNVYICIHILYIHMFIIFILYPFINDGYIYIYIDRTLHLWVLKHLSFSPFHACPYIRGDNYLFIFLHFLTFSCTREPGFSSYSICFCTAIEWTNVRIDRGKIETFHSVDPRKYIYIYISSTCLEARGSFSKFFPTSGSICISSSGNSIHCQEIVDDS